MRSLLILCGLILLAATTIAGCDTVTPVDDSRLVVEGFLTTGKPMPDIIVRRTLSPNRPYDSADAVVTNAAVEVVVGDARIVYDADPERRGVYVAGYAGDMVPAAGDRYAFRAAWRGSVADGAGVLPPAVEISDVRLTVPEEPVSAVLLDSLALADSITTGLYTGYIYPIEVSLTWPVSIDTGWDPGESWMRAQLNPFATISSPVVDLFLRSEEIFREVEQPTIDGDRTWTGVYAVGVSSAEEALPSHRLRVSLVRSGVDYARFAASKDAPERREPLSNLNGASGIFAAVSVDSARYEVDTDGSWSPVPSTGD